MTFDTILAFPLAALSALSLSTAGPGAATEPDWMAAAPLPLARQELYPVVAGDQIYVAGGILNPNTAYSDRFEVYSPRTDRWTRLADLPEARHHITLSHVDGRLYGVGGFSGGFPEWRAQPTVWIYDLAHDRWTAGVDLPEARAEGVAAVVAGRIHLIGGRVRVTDTASHFNDHVDSDLNTVFDPATGRWERRSNAPTARNSAAAAVIDGRIYVVGGRRFSRNESPGPIRQTNVATLEVYDPATDRWETRAPMPAAQAGLGAAAIDGLLHVCGGEQLPDRLFADCWVYDPGTDSWSAGPALSTPRHGIGMVALGDTLHVFGGALTPGGNAATDRHEIRRVPKGAR